MFFLHFFNLSLHLRYCLVIVHLKNFVQTTAFFFFPIYSSVVFPFLSLSILPLWCKDFMPSLNSDHETENGGERQRWAFSCFSEVQKRAAQTWWCQKQSIMGGFRAELHHFLLFTHIKKSNHHLNQHQEGTTVKGPQKQEIWKPKNKNPHLLYIKKHIHTIKKKKKVTGVKTFSGK